jgi:hypothetical protein
MSKYDMNVNNDKSIYIKILDKSGSSRSSNYGTFKLLEYAHKHGLTELMTILGDTDIYIDRNNLGEMSGLEIVTFYD